MIRSRFKHSFVIQSVLHSFSEFCVVLCSALQLQLSHLPQCYFSASVPSLKCACARGMSSMSSCLCGVSRARPITRRSAVALVSFPDRIFTYYYYHHVRSTERSRKSTISIIIHIHEKPWTKDIQTS